MRDRTARGGDIAERLVKLSAAVVRLAEALPKRPTTGHVALQLVRACTSAGANYQEARHAESRPDFIHKIAVAAKELGETLYWLGLVHELGLSADAAQLRIEADELIAIFVASLRTARSQ